MTDEDRGRWEARFRDAVHSLARLKLSADRDEHDYPREMADRDPDFRARLEKVMTCQQAHLTPQ